MREPKVVVLGGGSWGTTVASICARRGPTLQWVRSEETARDINENHRNTGYLGKDVDLSESLRATTDFVEAARCADVVVMGVPSHGFRDVLTELATELRPWVPVVSLVKGLEQGTNMRMSQIVDEVLPGHPAGILAGPNIAREVGVSAGTWRVVLKLLTLGLPSTKSHNNLEKPGPCSMTSSQPRAEATVPSILARLRTMPASPISFSILAGR